MSDITPSVDSTVNVPPTASVAESTVVLSTPEMFNPSTLSAPPSPPTPTFTPSNPDIGGANDGNNGSSVFGQGTSSASLYRTSCDFLNLSTSALPSPHCRPPHLKHTPEFAFILPPTLFLFHPALLVVA